jgi:hypothetical protein
MIALVSARLLARLAPLLNRRPNIPSTGFPMLTTRREMRKLIALAFVSVALVLIVSYLLSSTIKESEDEALTAAPAIQDEENARLLTWQPVEDTLVHTLNVGQKRPHENAVLMDISKLRETKWLPGDRITFVISQTGYTFETQIDEVNEIAPGITSIKSYPDPSLSNHILLTVSQKNTFMSLFTPEGEYELVGDKKYGWLVSSRLLGGPTADDAVVIKQPLAAIKAPMPKDPVGER